MSRPARAPELRPGLNFTRAARRGSAARQATAAVSTPSPGIRSGDRDGVAGLQVGFRSTLGYVEDEVAAAVRAAVNVPGPGSALR